MSKERAVRRAERERVATAAALRRQAERERTARAAARRQRLTAWIPRSGGRQTGVLAERRRTRRRMLVAGLVLVNLLVWLTTDGWAARFGALVVTLILLPLLIAATA